MSKIQNQIAKRALAARLEFVLDEDPVADHLYEEFKKGGRGNPEALISYWREGEGAARIGWGTEKDFTRCMKLVGKYLPEDAGGFCQNRHMEIYGESNAARDKKADAAAAKKKK